MRIEFVAECTSTNDLARRWLEGGGEGIYVVVAGSQTAGRGRHGRVWCSPMYAGVWMSVAFGGLRPRPLQTLAAGCAAHQTAKRFAPRAPLAIRWPNDITTAQNRKLCGILCEATKKGLVVGLGFNLHTSLLPPELEGVGLDEWIGAERVPDEGLHHRVAEALAGAVCEWVIRLEDEGADAIIDEAWERMWRGVVRGETGSGVVVGRIAGLDRDGALVVETEGRKQRLVAGDVRLLRLAKTDGGP